jgi:hypothetical protein
MAKLKVFMSLDSGNGVIDQEGIKIRLKTAFGEMLKSCSVSDGVRKKKVTKQSVAEIIEDNSEPIDIG